jgi:hypothetical protein
MTLGGTLITHNCIAYDYCVEAALRSLMGVCDEIVVADGYSTDGTDKLIDQVLSDFKGKWTCIHTAWKPSTMGTWLADLTNKAREALHTDMHLSLQGDEVLHEDSYREVRQLTEAGGIYTVERLNFWMDHRHVLPPNEKVGQTIVRLAPTSLPSVGDAQGLAHEQGWERSRIKVMHYGFIRRPQAWAAKSREMMGAWGWGVDPVVDKVEKEGLKALVDGANATAVTRNRLLPYQGKHPEVAREWLWKHGFSL